MRLEHIYLAEFSHGSARLARAPVLKETPKTFQLMPKPEQMSQSFMYVGTVVNKDRDHWFIGELDALLWLRDQAELYRNKCNNDLIEAEGTLRQLEGAIQKRREALS